MAPDASGGFFDDSEPMEIGRLQGHEIRTASEVLACSFADEGIMSYLLRTKPPRVRERLLRPFFRVMLRTFLPFGEVHTARLDGNLVGVGIRVPPGVFPMSIGLKSRMFLRMAPALVSTIIRAPSFRGLFNLMSTLEPLQPQESHWYLAFLGVSPDVQRRGIGANLANEVIALADAQEMPCYFETFGAHTKRMYERRGFQATNEVRPFSDGPLGWTMWRPPHGASS